MLPGAKGPGSGGYTHCVQRGSRWHRGGDCDQARHPFEKLLPAVDHVAVVVPQMDFLNTSAEAVAGIPLPSSEPRPGRAAQRVLRSLRRFHLDWLYRVTLALLLPVGISFYTFQTRRLLHPAGREP